MHLDESYSVPLDVEYSIQVKPRSLSGVLLSVFSHGAGPPGGDFLVLQLVNGQVSTYYTVSQNNDTDVAHCNFARDQPILVVFGRDIAERVCYQMAICYDTSSN